MPFEYILLYKGYILREKAKDYRAAWQTAYLLNVWSNEDADEITPADILPWVAEEEKKLKKENSKIQSTRENEEGIELSYTEKYGKALINYAAARGINLDTLSQEELENIGTESINSSVASQLNAPGFKMFERKYFGEFPD